MISVLCPSRSRPAQCRGTASILRSLAENPFGFEFLIRADEDDPHLPSYDVPGARLVIGAQYRGYSDMHRYMAELIARARGDVFLLWNDDARMTTTAWDRIIEEHAPTDKPWCGFCDTPGYTWAFPVINRKLIEVAGFPLHCAYDTWLCELTSEICSDRVPVFVEHRPTGPGYTDTYQSNNGAILNGRARLRECFAA